MIKISKDNRNKILITLAMSFGAIFIAICLCCCGGSLIDAPKSSLTEKTNNKTLESKLITPKISNHSTPMNLTPDYTFTALTNTPTTIELTKNTEPSVAPTNKPVQTHAAVNITKEHIIENNTQKQSITVYITNTGNKYHRDRCRYLRQSKIPISLDEAVKNYQPCSVCN